MLSEIKKSQAGRWAILLILVLAVQVLSAATLQQSLEAPDSLFMGSRFHLNIASEVELKDIEVPDTLSSFSILKTESLKARKQPSGLSLTIVALDTGTHTFPALVVSAVNPTNDTLRTDPFTLQILETRALQDTTLVDIAPTRKLKGELPYYAYYVIAALAVLAALILLILLIRKLRKKKETARLEEPARQELRPNWQKALDALDQLKAEKLPERGEFIEYHFRLSEIMKLFLEAEYKFSANEMTTREIRQHFNQYKVVSPDAQKEIVQWLESCDRIKFAKHVPTLEDSDKAMELFVQWLRRKSLESANEAPRETESD